MTWVVALGSLGGASNPVGDKTDETWGSSEKGAGVTTWTVLRPLPPISAGTLRKFITHLAVLATNEGSHMT